jgi:hypothetical protein
MEDKQKATLQKVTLYLSPELHRRLKVQAAVEVESMSAIAERAVTFYLTNPEVVEAGSYGQSHRVYSCPACATPTVLRDGDLVALSSQLTGRSSVLSDSDEELSVSASVVGSSVVSSNGIGSSASPLLADIDERQRESEQLVPC